MTVLEKFTGPDDGPFPWVRRRRFLYVVNLYCAACTMYILYNRIDGLVAQTVVAMAFGTHASSVAAYVFGAVWQDVNSIRAGSAAGYTRRSNYDRMDRESSRESRDSDLPRGG